MNKVAEVIKQYMKEKGIGVIKCSRELGINKAALSAWLRRESTRFKRLQPEYQEILRKKFPGIFDDESGIALPSIGALEEKKAIISDPELWSRIVHAQSEVKVIIGLLEWFIFRATAREREKLRDVLNNEMYWFYDLAAAIMSEKSREVILAEGRLNPGRRPKP